MQSKPDFSDEPQTFDLPYSIEYWDEEKIGDSDGVHTPDEVEAFVHPRTATAARILSHDDGTYSVQTAMGDYAGGDCVVQPDDPSSSVSGSAGVVMMSVDSVEGARMAAYAWITGWVHRNVNTGNREGDVLDAEKDSRGTPIP